MEKDGAKKHIYLATLKASHMQCLDDHNSIQTDEYIHSFRPGMLSGMLHVQFHTC